MHITFATTPASVFAAVDVLTHSLQRGDFDDDDNFADAVDRAIKSFETAATNALNDKLTDDPKAKVTVEVEPFDEILTILESDRSASTALAPLIADANAAFNAQP